MQVKIKEEPGGSYSPWSSENWGGLLQVTDLRRTLPAGSGRLLDLRRGDDRKQPGGGVQHPAGVVAGEGLL